MLRKGFNRHRLGSTGRGEGKDPKSDNIACSIVRGGYRSKSGDLDCERQPGRASQNIALAALVFRTYRIEIFRLHVNAAPC